MSSALQAVIPDSADSSESITGDLALLQTGIANLYFAGPKDAGDRGWTLIDAGVPGFARRIRRAAAERFGAGSRPNAIILTHGHFDHVGALEALAEEWDAPVYAHELELPYLTGMSRYPPGDSSVGGGLMAASAWLYPRGPVDVRPRARPLPADGSVPGMPGWRWLHTPGHSPGHIALFRDEDRILISGDAVITVKQESLLAVLSQEPEFHGPPAYFTPDWAQAERSVHELAELPPWLVASGHGYPMYGPSVEHGLKDLATHFRLVGVPSGGRYVNNPAVMNANGLVWAPPSRVARPLFVTAALMLIAIWLVRRLRS